jgi:general secretion pathway protein B
MSYILDALRKSQQARQPAPTPEPRGAVHNISLSWPNAGWWLAAGLVLLFGLLIAAFVFWRGTAGGAPPVPAETTPPSASAIEPAPVAEEKTPPVETLVRNMPPVHDLAEEAKVPVRVIAKKPERVHDADKAQANHRPAAPETATTALLAPDDAPLLQDMPTNFQRALPSLRVSIHVYAPDPSQRILFINNRQYRQGDRIEGDIRVEEIVPDGVILSYRGERFKLGRPR